MAKPKIDIHIDEDTGRWIVDEVPMILVPQHFLMNNQLAIENSMGADALSQVLAPAGRTSAYVWCKQQSELYSLKGEEVFRHYMRRLSQRGWGLFDPISIDPSRGRAIVRLSHSALIDGSRTAGGHRKCCYMFEPWLKGALEFVCESNGRPMALQSRETQCAAEGHAHCSFEVSPEVAHQPD